MKNTLPIEIAKVIGLESLDSLTIEIVQGVSDEFDSINEMISNHSVRWESDRLPVVEVCILQCAIFELLGGDNTVGTVINEAVELTKHLALPESTNYINGILSAVANEYLNK
ncbi:MAG: transcription antitermination protein NusB [Actinomycetota bacterium]|nr:transcription antitermination protein NusB [Actinomycetota bacterium]